MLSTEHYMQQYNNKQFSNKEYYQYSNEQSTECENIFQSCILEELDFQPSSFQQEKKNNPNNVNRPYHKEMLMQQMRKKYSSL